MPAAAPGLEEAKLVSGLLAGSGFFADARQPGQAVAKVLAGRELGFGPVASMSGVYIVKGRPTFSANLMAAAVQNSGRFRFRVRKHTNECCEIEFQERCEQPDGRWAWEPVGVSTFDHKDAQAGGLPSQNDNYRKFPRNMLYARAMSNGCKWYCPSVFAGHTPYTPDELDDNARMTEDGEFVVAAGGMTTAALPHKPEQDAALRSRLDALVARTGVELPRLLAHYKLPGLDYFDDALLRQASEVLLARLSPARREEFEASQPVDAEVEPAGPAGPTAAG